MGDSWIGFYFKQVGQDLVFFKGNRDGHGIKVWDNGNET